MLLIVDKSNKNGKTARDMAYIMGFLAQAVSPYDFFKEISPFYSAVLVIDPAGFKEDREYFEKMCKFKLGIPFFALCPTAPSEPILSAFDKIIIGNEFTSRVMDQMLTYAKANGVRPLGEYCGYGYQASVRYKDAEYFERPIKITKTEKMILRFLIRAYPMPMNAERILKYAFKPGKQIETASIRTHISLLNKQCRDVAERNVIEFVPKSGYTVYVPKN